MADPGTYYTEETGEPLSVVISKFLDRDPWALMAMEDGGEARVKMSFRAGNGPKSLVEMLAMFEASVGMIRIQLRNSGLDPDDELSKLDAEIAAEEAAEKEA